MSAMWEDMPGPDLELLRRANLCFQAYIFYHNPSRHTREGHCTACDADLWVSNPQRTITSDDLDFLNARHNESGRCPKCGNPVIYKQIGKSKSRSSLRATGRIVFILPVNENKVYARAFCIVKDYTNYRDGYIECMWQAERTRYIWQPGEYSVYKYDECRLGVRQNGSIPKYDFIRTSLIEPFTATNMGGDLKEYKIVNEDALKDCFLRYAQLDSFKREDAKIYRFYFYSDRIFKYLSLYCEHPQFEMLMKLGHRDAVDEFVYNNRKNTSILKWEAKDPASFFRMSKQKYKEFWKYGGNLQLLKAYKKLYKISPNSTSYEIVNNYMSTLNFYYNEWQEIVIKYHIPHVHYFNYLQKSAEKLKLIRDAFVMHRDYLKSAEKLEYDLTNEVVLLPNKLKKAHDIAYKTVQAKQEEIKEKKRVKEEEEANSKLTKLYNKRDQQYVYSDENFCIVQPETMQDIINEGKTQEHCVGGYALRHAQGKLTILFLRNINTPDVSYQTIEMDGKTMRQIQGYKNKTPLSKMANDFLQRWLKWVENGSERDKDGNPIIADEEHDRVMIAS